MNAKNPHTNRMAADMVAQQIALYDQEIERLNEQVNHLEARKEAVVMMRKALTRLIAESNGQLSLVSQEGGNGTGTLPTPELAMMAAMPTMTVAVAPIANDIAKTVHHPTSTGFAAAVRDVLREAPKGLKPSKVAEQMKTRGTAATYTGKTPFNSRVGNELHRLMKAGEVGRRSGRYYLVVQEQHQ
jgi:ABC-type transport system involved in cytochrome bd biosynthesis fused ATPase/permease subunit